MMITMETNMYNRDVYVYLTNELKRLEKVIPSGIQGEEEELATLIEAYERVLKDQAPHIKSSRLAEAFGGL